MMISLTLILLGFGLMSSRVKILFSKGALYSMNVHVDILMWKDPWVPTLNKFILNFDHPNPNSHSLNLVADLIDSRTSSWNLDVLNETFSHDNVNEIIKIHISALVKPKTLLWSPSMSGKFFSKSAYHVFQSNRFRPCNHSTSFN